MSNQAKTKYEQAKERVRASPHLSPHADFILTDWPEGEEHWNWVCTANEDEILDWVQIQTGSK